jgi:putative membrane protein
MRPNRSAAGHGIGYKLHREGKFPGPVRGTGGIRTMELTSGYLWFKALHIAFMVTWFAGLFYLPRLFIYHSEAEDDLSRDRFNVMERRLFIIMTIGAVLTAIFGLLLLWINQALLQQGWFHVKVALLAGMFVYHLRCNRWIALLKSGRIPDNTKWLRWFNEIPVLFLLGIVCLAVVKPF